MRFRPFRWSFQKNKVIDRASRCSRGAGVVEDRTPFEGFLVQRIPQPRKSETARRHFALSRASNASRAGKARS
jgi:hypothetical protein